MAKLTPFGVALRKLRIDHELRLYDLAEKIGRSVSLISAIETGRKPIPDDFVPEVIKALGLSRDEAAALKVAEDKTVDEVNVSHLRPDDRELVQAFARRSEELPDDIRQKLRNLLLKSVAGEVAFSRKRRGIKVAPKSLSEIREIARFLRASLGLDARPYFPIVDVLERAMPFIDPAFVLDVQTREEMGDDEGLVPIGSNTLILREDVYMGACKGEPRPRFTAVHELGHYLMHKQISFARSCKDEDPIYMDAEWQADEFASHLMVPQELLNTCLDEADARDTFGISAHAARCIWSKRGPK